MTRYIGLLGPTQEELADLSDSPWACEYDFAPILDRHRLLFQDSYDVDGLLEEACRQIDRLPGKLEALVSSLDFPTSCVAAVLRRRYGLPGPSLSAVLKCEHKFWSRREQRMAAPQAVPAFAAFDPFDPEAFRRIAIQPPFWIKPIKSIASFLAFRIRNESDFAAATTRIRRHIDHLSAPFEKALRWAEVPPEIAGLPRHSCLAEAELTGRQCTLEGYAVDNRIVTYGVVDSVRGHNQKSFARYQYPSGLPRKVRKRMEDVAAQVIARIGFERGCFNIEFFWDPRSDAIGILEINPRFSASHSWLFQMVDGVSNTRIGLAAALGEPAKLRRPKGPFRCAGRFFLRRSDDGIVTEVPTAQELAAIDAALPGTIVVPEMEPGTRLSERLEQDSYSYHYATIMIGGDSRSDLLRRYRECTSRLRFSFEDAI